MGVSSHCSTSIVPCLQYVNSVDGDRHRMPKSDGKFLRPEEWRPTFLRGSMTRFQEVA
jgi:hypothetical protein